MTDKPLSESHKTLWDTFENVPAPNGSQYYTMSEMMDVIQSTTIDIAEHELVLNESAERFGKLIDANLEVARLKKEVEKLEHAFKEYDAVIIRSAENEERLKKELDLAIIKHKHTETSFTHDQTKIIMALCDTATNEGLAEGERRAMKRVKEHIESRRLSFEQTHYSAKRPDIVQESHLREMDCILEYISELGLDKKEEQP